MTPSPTKGNGNGRNSHDKRRLKAKLFGGRASAKCCFCKKELSPATATLEHVVTVSAGGGWGIDNLRLSCARCNGDRGDELFAEYKAKFKTV